MTTSSRIAVLFAVTALLGPAAAWAAKPSKVADLPGEAYVVRCNPEGTWVATWAEQTKGNYTLFAIDASKGDKREVMQTEDPGGLTWIPGKNTLMYCKGKAVKSQKIGEFTQVTYYLYDAAKNANKKITELKDDLKTYIFDPVAAEDGNKVFHLTIKDTYPSFNIYFPGSNTMSPMLAKARIGADYDLSSDGSLVYWPMTQENGNLVIAGWSLEKNNYKGLYEFKKDPASGRGGFKVDSPNRQAVSMATSEADPTLKAVVYSFKDPKNPQAIPVKLKAEEEIVMVDWKGRSGNLYMIIARGAGKGSLVYSIIEVNPTSGARTVVLPESSDEIRFVDYASRTGAYFYSAVLPGKGTRIVKLQ
jgi:hypothetical protein